MSVQKTVAPKINFDSLSENYQKWFLPERILVGLPENIPEGQKFIIIIGKQITKSSYKQIKVEYDVNGKLSNLVSEVYEIVTN